MNKKSDVSLQSTVAKSERSYELDFLKLLFALFVFWSHTEEFIGKNTRISLPLQLGSVSVHFFFVVSGMLMAKSIVKRSGDGTDHGKFAISFVLNKYKSIFPQFFSAFLINIVVNIIINPIEKAPVKLASFFPELAMLTRSGVSAEHLCVVWYISAMLIMMLPLSYLLSRFQSFTLHVFSPFVAVMSLGYICQTNKYIFFQQDEWYGFCKGGTFRAVCGLCFGICAYNIYAYISKCNLNKNMRKLLTITEIMLYTVFFATWFLLRDNKAIMSVVLFLPIAIAITFSGKSYVGNLFRFKWMRFFAPLSLIIYLNHITAVDIIRKYFSGASYKKCVLWMSAITLCTCLLSVVIVKLGKMIWKRLKVVFTKPDTD